MIASAFLTVIGLCAAATGPGDDTPDVFKLMEQGEAFAAAGLDDFAVGTLHRAEARLGEVSSVATRESLREGLMELLERLDRQHEERRLAQKELAKRYRSLARSYQRKRWHRVALGLLEQASAFDYLPRDKGLEAARASAGALVEPPVEPEEPAAPEDLLDALDAFYEQPEKWKRDEDGYHSPPLEGWGCMLLANAPRHRDNLLSIEMLVSTEKESLCGLAFGVVGEQEQYVCDINTFPGNAWVEVRIWHFDGNDAIPVAKHGGPMPDAILKDWNELTVEVRGQRVKASFGGITAEGVCPTRPQGGVGMYVSGSSENREPIGFRKLHITELPAASSESEDPEAPQSLGGLLAERIGAAEQQIAAGEVESGVLALMEVRLELDGIASPNARGALDRVTAALLEEHDILYKRRSELNEQTVLALIGIGREYLAQGYPIAGIGYFKQALLHDRELTRAELKANATLTGQVRAAGSEDPVRARVTVVSHASDALFFSNVVHEKGEESFSLDRLLAGKCDVLVSAEGILFGAARDVELESEAAHALNIEVSPGGLLFVTYSTRIPIGCLFGVYQKGRLVTIVSNVPEDAWSRSVPVGELSIRVLSSPASETIETAVVRLGEQTTVVIQDLKR